jgi:Selenoprotein, putative
MRVPENATPLSRVARSLRTVWRGLREWCDDAAYERYLSSRATRASAQAPLTAQEFYVERVNRRYSRPSRCC